MKCFATIAAVALLSHLAHAQGAADDKAVAAQLFDDADRLMSAGKIADACPKFAESQRLDPQLGTLLHLSECLAQVGKNASAWVSFKDALEIATQRSDPREARIRARLAELEQKLSRLVISVAPNAPADLEVKRDGGVVGQPVWGSAVPVDAGEHTISASAPGRAPWSQRIRVGEAGTTSVTVPELPIAALAQPEPAAEPARAASPQPAPAARAPVSIDASPAVPPASMVSESPAPGRTQRILGWSAIGAGAVGLAIGIGFELKTQGKLSDADALCPSAEGCELGTQARIHRLTEDARSARGVGIVGFVVGGVLAAAGVTLLLTAPHAETPQRAMNGTAPAPRGGASMTFAPAFGHAYQGVVLSGWL